MGSRLMRNSESLCSHFGEGLVQSELGTEAVRTRFKPRVCGMSSLLPLLFLLALPVLLSERLNQRSLSVCSAPAQVEWPITCRTLPTLDDGNAWRCRDEGKAGETGVEIVDRHVLTWETVCFCKSMH